MQIIAVIFWIYFAAGQCKLLYQTKNSVVDRWRHDPQSSSAYSARHKPTISSQQLSSLEKGSSKIRLLHIYHQARLTYEETLLDTLSGARERPPLLRADFGPGSANAAATSSESGLLDEFEIGWRFDKPSALVDMDRLEPKESVKTPDPFDIQNVLSLAKMTNNAYLDRGHSTWLPVDGHTVNMSVGWDSNGLRGYVFSSDSHDLLVISLKGTSAQFFGIGTGPTSKRDKIEDNLMFSCCCAAVDRTWWPVCSCAYGKSCDLGCSRLALDAPDSYVNSAIAIYNQLRLVYPKSSIWFTGHSLGGAVAALAAYKVDVPAVTFEAPGDRLVAYKLGWPLPQAQDKSDKIWHFGLSTDPIFTGTCMGSFSSCYIAGYAMESFCHMGNICVIDNPPTTSNGTDLRTHRLGYVIDKLSDRSKTFEPFCFSDPLCRDCAEWDFTEVEHD